MGWLHKLFGQRESAPNELERANETLQRFLAASLAEVDHAALDRDRLRQKLAVAYGFGAVESLANRFELDETRALALAVKFLDRHFANMPGAESVTGLRREFADDIESRLFQREGAESIRRWLANADSGAVRRLSELLRHV